MFRARGIGLALLSLLALLATESPCRAEDPAPNGAASAPAWVPFTLSPEQPPSSLPPGTGPVEKLVDDFFGQLVSAVAEYPGNYFTLAVPDFADRSAKLGGRSHLRNLLLLRLIETGRFKIVGQRQPAGAPGGEAETEDSRAAPPDLTLLVSVDRTARWVTLSGLVAFRGKPGSDRVLIAAADRDAALDALLEGGTAQSMGRGFELLRIGSAADSVLDATAGDLDGSGHDLLVLLASRSVMLLDLKAGRTGEVRSLVFPQVPRLVRPPRSPRGTVTALAAAGDKPARVLAAESELQLPVEWNVAAAQARASLFEGAFPLAPGRSPGTVLVGKLWPGRNTFEATLVSAEPSSQSKGPSQALPFPFYALERGSGAAAEGVGVLDTDWTLHLLTGDLNREIGKIERCGSSFAILNLLEDGSWEVATSSPALAGSGEKLSVFQVSSSGTHLVWQTEGVASPVCAMAAGDFFGSGRNEAVAIECGSQPGVLLIRRVEEKAKDKGGEKDKGEDKGKANVKEQGGA